MGLVVLSQLVSPSPNRDLEVMLELSVERGGASHGSV